MMGWICGRLPVLRFQQLLSKDLMTAIIHVAAVVLNHVCFFYTDWWYNVR